MKTKLFYLVPLFVFGIFFTNKAQNTSGDWISNEKYSRVIFSASPDQLVRMAKIGIATDHLSQKSPDKYIGEFSQQEIEWLNFLDINSEILISDLEDYYAAQLSIPALANKTATDPANFHLGSMGGYLTWAEMVNELDSMKILFPNLITTKASIGTSVEGKNLWMVKISDNPSVDEAEPEVLYDAMHHAREPIAMMNLIYYMWHILENYGTDPEITCLVDNREMYFVPVVNPDGYVYNQTTNPNGGGMWRKNRRNNGDGTYGIDLNRNYSWQFGYDDVGSSPSTSSDTYRGPNAFSEPETQAMRDFQISRDFTAALSYHGYGNFLIYPWSHLPNFYTPDDDLYIDLGADLVADNQFFPGTANQTLSYQMNGASIDWQYGEQVAKDKIIAFLPEIGSGDQGFWPMQSDIIPLCALQITQNIKIAEAAGTRMLQFVNAQDTVIGTNVDIPVTFWNLGTIASPIMTATFVTSDPSIQSVNNVITVPYLNPDSTNTQTFNLTLANGIAPGAPIQGEVVLTGPDMCERRDSVLFNYSMFVDIEPGHSNSIVVYPNPVQDGTIRISGSSLGSSLRIISFNGQLVGEWNLQEDQLIQLPEISSGLYLWEVSENEKLTGRGKIAIQK